MAGPYRETPWERIVAVHWGSDVTAWVVGFLSEGSAPEGEAIPEIGFTLSTEGEGVFQVQVVNFDETTDLGEFGTHRTIGKGWHISGATEVRITITPPTPPPAAGITNGTASIFPGIYTDGVVTGIEGALSLTALVFSTGGDATTVIAPPDTGSPPHPTGVTISGSSATLLWVKGDNPRLL